MVFPSQTGRDASCQGDVAALVPTCVEGQRVQAQQVSAVIGRPMTSGAGLTRGFAWTALGTVCQDGVIYF